MLLRQLCLAATTAAFLVVPDVLKHDKDHITTLPIEDGIDAFSLPPTALSQTLDLPCRKCRGHNAHLKMDFAIEGGHRLTLNGFELYPNADPWHGDMIASVVRGHGKERKQRLGYSLAVKPEGMDEEQQMEVIGVELRVIEVGHRFVEDIPSIKVKLVRASTKELLIGSLEVNEPSPAECQSMWCRAKGIFGDAFKGFSGCRKFRHAHDPQKHHPDAPEPPHSHHPRPGHHGRPEDVDAKPPAHHQWRHLVKGLASHIFLPVLMGITAGFGVALFVMILCRLALRLTRLISGEKQPAFLRCPHRQRSRDAENALVEEKAALMDDQNLPPYEDDTTKN